ncbi:DUF3027 domain-containing protein [Bifidobacterium sp. SMB2]|uniref:DUF3027 domain-containing protein n=1 Tax=Bifidobacterium saimiriisciurei TaxID=2661627 RepID=A0ABX0C9Y7_9BIFI|nr:MULTISPECIES: DUF3027 domain-containing protein [Bifidobacterium]NEG95619.1 DUF3027 domain-containing protein [Bifidobacterium sp. SMB2]NEH11932.1 DUF3027 domain-containing protein [Bifidobacterium saimiriisciurei]
MNATAEDPRSLARAVACEVADETSHVGDFLGSTELGDGVSDFRFASNIVGYEGWQWSVTLYHDVERDAWTVNESSLVPGEDSLMPPKWIPWKDRLLPTDLAVTDALGTEPDDPRLEDGEEALKAVEESIGEHGAKPAAASAEPTEDPTSTSEPAETPQDEDDVKSEEPTDDAGQSSEKTDSEGNGDADTTADTDAAKSAVKDELAQTAAIAKEFELSRRRVLTPLGRAQAAQRWYSGPHGPKSLSTKTADGLACQTCGFFVPLAGELNLMFGVCANKWSPDDGRVVSRDHGCGEHSEIEPPEPSSLWIQSKPAFDDMHIDIVRQAPREERGDVEAMESAGKPRFDDAGHYLGVKAGDVVLFHSQMPEREQA